MFLPALIAGLLCVVAWGYLFLGHGRFWRIRSALPAFSSTEITQLRIAVVIPARNEADVIGRAIASLLCQGEHELHIFVVDDHSSDGTAAVAQAATGSNDAGAPPFRMVSERVGENEASSHLAVISGRPLPPGWSGKLWAMQQGIEQALRLNPDFLLLTDADIEHAPGSVAKLVSIAEAGDYDLASFMVKLHCRSFAEKLLIPAFVFFFFMLYPPEWVRDQPRLAPKGRARTWGTKTAGAAGGCMLVRPAALRRIGGIAMIRQELIDDCALAQAIKRSGGKVWLGVEGSSRLEHRKIQDRTASNLASSEEHESGHDPSTGSGRAFSRVEQTPNLAPSGLHAATRETRSLRPYESFGEIERMIARSAFNQLHHSIWLLLGTIIGMLLLYVLPIALILSGLSGAGVCRRIRLRLDDVPVPADGSLLRPESTLGADAAVGCPLLHDGDDSFGRELLGRARRRMEGPRAGCRIGSPMQGALTCDSGILRQQPCHFRAQNDTVLEA